MRIERSEISDRVTEPEPNAEIERFMEGINGYFIKPSGEDNKVESYLKKEVYAKKE